MNKQIYSVGIIGNGRFGALLYKIFLEQSNGMFIPKLYSRKEKPDSTKFFSLDEVIKSDILIPTVPISSFENQIKEIAEEIGITTLVVDVCSVSVHPTKVLERYLNSEIDFISTHPMWGPDSTQNGTFFKDLKFIYHKTRVKNDTKYQDFTSFFRNLEFEMIELTPEEHDKQAAYTHAFAFLVGKIGIDLKIRRNHISTKGFEGILYNQEAVENDTGQLFHDLMTYNPYTKEMREKVKLELEKIEKELKF